MAVRKRGNSWQMDYLDPNGKRIRKSFKGKKAAFKALHRGKVGLNLMENVCLERFCPTVNRIIDSMFCHDSSKRHINSRLRMAVLKRDGEKCIKCGSNGLGTVLEVDHIIPVAEGGKTMAGNLQTLCKQCNIGKFNIFAE